MIMIMIIMIIILLRCMWERVNLFYNAVCQNNMQVSSVKYFCFVWYISLWPVNCMVYQILYQNTMGSP